MAKRRKNIFIICLSTIVVVLAWLYISLVYMRTPDYVFKHIAPIYESEAKDFYEQNLDALTQLLQLSKAIKTEESYNYTFHVHEFDTPGLSEEIGNALQEIEKEVESQYTFTISRDFMEVRIASKTNLIVTLYSGKVPYNVDPDWIQTISLDPDWNINLRYIIRS